MKFNDTKFRKRFFIAIRTGNLPVVRGALLEGADPNEGDENGLTPLIWSARKGQIAVLDELLKFGADLNAKDRDGRTLFHHCVLFSRDEYMKHLLKVPNAPMNVTDGWGYTPLDIAILENGQRSLERKKRSECEDMLRDAGAIVIKQTERNEEAIKAKKNAKPSDGGKN